ncbi:Diaminopimelate epimerase-like protein [Viridothelium virens]|uniref:Diaminopimelate epimerase-like protein n=1 Tax=Viridothelium virens TaxID=1048519 RepID=A0A6A6HGP6_VIRVR|nr:Diaminopimelate epimerase-like protein [Viridothelium virens]
MGNQSLEYVTLDVFTQTRFAGNPLAVVKVPQSVSVTQEQKQRIAREFNYSETTFIHERVEGGSQNHWTVDIFTKDREIPFAGHPTIGTACFALGDLAKDTNTLTQGKFSIKAGPVDLVYENKRASASIPHNVRLHQATLGVSDLYRIQPALHTLKRNGQTDLSPEFPVFSIVKGMTFPLIQLPDLDALGALSTGSEMADVELDEGWCDLHGLCYYYVRLPESEDGTVNLRTRLIKGILEDPATGSAASALTSFLSMQGKYAGGQKIKYCVTQGVEMGRKSEIRLTITMTEVGGIGNVTLEGSAVKVMEGRVYL